MEKFRKILLVDDDLVTNFLTQEILIDMNLAEGIAVTTNGEEALKYFENSNVEDFEYELVLLDLNMPIMNGFEFLDQLYSKYSHIRQKIKVVVLTSSSAGSDMENLRKRKVDGFIVKPLTRKNLTDILKML